MFGHACTEKADRVKLPTWPPIVQCVVLAAVLRLVSAVFSEGYLMHDDHFLVVEVGASWAEGEDYNAWLPEGQRERGVEVPTPHPGNFVYPGIHAGLFLLMNTIGLDTPSAQMVVIRLLHGMWSLLVVVFGMRIAGFLGGSRVAERAGWMLAALAWMPIVSVHQLVETACIPPMLAAIWWWMKTPVERHTRWTWVAVGCAWGLATGLRFQVGIAAVGFAAAVVVTHRRSAFPGLFAVAVAALSVFSLTQISDVWIWGEPFAQLRAYFGYNTEQAGNYPQGPAYQYILTLAGLLLPPFSVVLLWGVVKHWKSAAVVVWPALFFFLFHSIFPNKQERFILPIVPLLIVAGLAGLQGFEQVRWQRLLWRIGWVINAVALAVLTPATFKRSRMDAMDRLHAYGDVRNFLAVQVDSGALPPQFYWGSWTRYWTTDGSTSPEEDKRIYCSSDRPPDAVLFYGDQGIPAAVARYKVLYPTLEFVEEVPAGWLDRFVHGLNPINSVERVAIYRIAPALECAER